MNDQIILKHTRAWLEQAVIGLNLCPFAKAVFQRERIRFVLSQAQNTHTLLQDLSAELALLMRTPAEQIETTLLIHPQVLTEFADYSRFLHEANLQLAIDNVVGDIQLASFHPQYQFAGTEAHAVSNATNRAPYPLLHLLREQSITRALTSYPDPAAIVLRNQALMEKLGPEGWASLRDSFMA
jgi:uncharacterized protein